MRSSAAAALLAGAEPTHTEALRRYGLHFGLAYQLLDDWLDYAGTSADMGKNVGDDLAEGKPTLPLVLAMERVPDLAERLAERRQLRGQRRPKPRPLPRRHRRPRRVPWG